jgi:hypothetical protein
MTIRTFVVIELLSFRRSDVELNCVGAQQEAGDRGRNRRVGRVIMQLRSPFVTGDPKFKLSTKTSNISAVYASADQDQRTDLCG